MRVCVCVSVVAAAAATAFRSAGKLVFVALGTVARREDETRRSRGGGRASRGGGGITAGAKGSESDRGGREGSPGGYRSIVKSPFRAARPGDHSPRPPPIVTPDAARSVVPWKRPSGPRVHVFLPHTCRFRRVFYLGYWNFSKENEFFVWRRVFVANPKRDCRKIILQKKKNNNVFITETFC